MAKQLAKPTLMTLNRDYNLQSLLGHRVVFEKDVPTPVPPALFREAVAIGAVRADGEAPDIQDEKKDQAEPSTLEERESKIKEAIELIVADNNRDDFTAAGAPSQEAVTRIVGFKVQTKEIKPIWAAFQAAQAGE